MATLEHGDVILARIREKTTKASTLLQQGRIDEACALANEAYQEGVSSLGTDHSSTVRALAAVGKATTYQGRFQDGERIAHEVVEKYTEQLGKEHVDTLRAKNNLVTSLSYQSTINEAYELVEVTSRTADENAGRSSRRRPVAQVPAHTGATAARKSPRERSTGSRSC